jgi:hypothetical protein
MNILALASLIARTNAAASAVVMVLGEINKLRASHANRDELPEVLTVADLAPEFETKRAALLAANEAWLQRHANGSDDPV